MGKAKRSQSQQKAIDNKRARNNPSNPQFCGKGNNKVAKRSARPDGDNPVHANTSAFIDEELEALRESNKPYHEWQGRFGRYQNDSDYVAIIHRYDPGLELACEMMKVAYGSVGVASSYPGAISFEYSAYSSDRSCYHNPEQRRIHQLPWTTFVRETLAKDRARICEERGITEEDLEAENVVTRWQREQAEEAQALVLQASLDEAGI